ncbi:MAG TPA: Crp/Fnr family transcriptional regulator [Cytophagales bacterium]|nr:Crp/Fnr family transcriptional regulator [Cytophagales bacterium]
MEQLKNTMRQMISVTDRELEGFLKNAVVKTFAPKEIMAHPGAVPNEIFFINRGLLRVLITDQEGTEHTIHFALENQFIADYSSFIRQDISVQTLQALEEVEAVVLPRTAIHWGYANMQDGQKMGRLVAEYYFIYQDERIKNLYARTPKERYDTISEVFPNIHQRVPQHMIASYLGMTPVHLSRLKKAALAAEGGN